MGQYEREDYLDTGTCARVVTPSPTKFNSAISVVQWSLVYKPHRSFGDHGDPHLFHATLNGVCQLHNQASCVPQNSLGFSLSRLDVTPIPGTPSTRFGVDLPVLRRRIPQRRLRVRRCGSLRQRRFRKRHVSPAEDSTALETPQFDVYFWRGGISCLRNVKELLGNAQGESYHWYACSSRLQLQSLW